MPLCVLLVVLMSVPFQCNEYSALSYQQINSLLQFYKIISGICWVGSFLIFLKYAVSCYSRSMYQSRTYAGSISGFFRYNLIKSLIMCTQTHVTTLKDNQ